MTISRVENKYALGGEMKGLFDRTGLDTAIYRYISEYNWDSFVISELFDSIASPGSLFRIDKGQLNIRCHTHQQLNAKRMFQGLTYPITDPRVMKHLPYMESAIALLAELWQDEALTGFANIDWIITADGRCMAVDFNPRQTAVVAPLHLCRKILGSRDEPRCFNSVDVSIMTNDYITVPTGTFTSIHRQLQSAGLLIEQHDKKEGIVITIPPLPTQHPRLIGVMAIAESMESAQGYMTSTLHEVGATVAEPLFECS